jgi:hypothetical protein
MYEVIDNFLPEEEFNNIKNIVMGNNFPWYYNSSVADDTDISSFYFVHAFFNNLEVNSNYYIILSPILQKLNVKALIRAKGNLYPRTEQLINHKQHTDYDFEHKGAVFYINTNNGSTILDDGTKIASVENRLLVFESHKSHNSTNCTDEQTRVNINFNYF